MDITKLTSESGFWLLIDKPIGISSAEAIQPLKRLFWPMKIGHAGTLDPFASGLLLIGVGDATKLMEYAITSSKAYDFTITWGEYRDTNDITGKVVTVPDVANSSKVDVNKFNFNIGTSSDNSNILSNDICIYPNYKQIFDVTKQFIGIIEQVPPSYSAVKINGQRAYTLARKGIEIELKSKKVQCTKLEILQHFFEDIDIGTYILYNDQGRQKHAQIQIDITNNSNIANSNISNYITNNAKCITTFSLECSKGFYVRSLARDIAITLKVPGYVSKLRRIKIGNFSIDDAITIDYIIECMRIKDYNKLRSFILPLSQIVQCNNDKMIGAIQISHLEYSMLLQGQYVTLKDDYHFEDVISNKTDAINKNIAFVVIKNNIVVGIVEICNDKIIKPRKIFKLAS